MAWISERIVAALTRWRTFLTTVGAAATGIAHAVLRRRGQISVRLKPGDVAPLFELPGSDGRFYRLAEMRGKTVVLAWFPKAFTGG